MKNIFLFLSAVFLLLSALPGDEQGDQIPASFQSGSHITKIDTNVILPPAWAFGIVYGAYTNQAETIDLIDRIIEHDYPIDGFWIDSWIWDWQNKGRGPDKYIDFVADTIAYPDLRAMWNYMHLKNIKSGMWIWNCILQTGNEAVYADFKSRGYFSREFIQTDTWHNQGQKMVTGPDGRQEKGTWCGDINFQDSGAVSYFEKKMAHFFDQGLDFIKLDRTAAVPVCKAVFNLTQNLGKESGGRGFILSHSHYEGEAYKRYPAKWTDDTRSTWSAGDLNRKFSPWIPEVGFKENLAMYTDAERRYHKIPFLTNDLGGYAVSLDRYVDEELYVRWLEFAVFVPLTTPFAQPENPTHNIAFMVSEKADSLFRTYAHLKMEYFPYIYTYAHRSRLEGINTIRPIPGYLYQYLFGAELLVAPVYAKGDTMRMVYLPEGSAWIYYWNKERFDGGQIVTVTAPLEKIPLFVKQGAVIPKRKYARSVESGSNDTLELHVYSGSDGRFNLIEDDGRSNQYLKGVYATTQILHQNLTDGLTVETWPVEGSYEGMKDERTWEVVVHLTGKPSNLTLNGEPLDYQITNGNIRTRAFSADKHSHWKLNISY